MNLVLKIVIILTVNFVKSEKVFKSVPNTVKAYENETVTLPCYIDDGKNYAISFNQLLWCSG